MPPSIKTGLLGGSFDPVHLGHLALAVESQKNLSLEEVWFIPAAQSPYKRDKPQASDQDRLAMLQLAVQSNPKFKVCDLELNRPGPSYTVDTLEELTRDHPQREWYSLMGLDAFLDFPNWRNAGRLLTLTHLVVGLRPGWNWEETENVLDRLSIEDTKYRLSEENGPARTYTAGDSRRTIVLLKMPPHPAASRLIRRFDTTDLPNKNELPVEVVQYIMDHHLYD